LQYFSSNFSKNINSNIESESTSLHIGKVLASWTVYDQFINNWGKSNNFSVIKNKVVKEENNIRKRTYICKHEKKYTTKSTKNTSIKKMLYPWHVNTSCPKVNNPDSTIFINKIVNEHNHNLNIEVVAFKKDIRFSNEIIDDVQFLTQYCRIEVTAQRRYLEGKYSYHTFFS